MCNPICATAAMAVQTRYLHALSHTTGSVFPTAADGRPARGCVVMWELP